MPEQVLAHGSKSRAGGLLSVKFPKLMGQAQCLYRYRDLVDNNIDALQKSRLWGM